MRDVPIDRIMTPDLTTVGPNDAVAEARRLFDTNVIHHLPVVESGRLVGMVSSSDLLKLHLLDEKMAIHTRATVDQIMETNLIVLHRNDTLRDAAGKLCMGGFHALPVVNRKQQLLGIVTSSDLIGELVSQLYG